MATLSQKRAADAYRQIHAIADQNKYANIRKKYGTLAHGFGTMIQTNGLGPAMAFLWAKAENHADSAPKVLFDQISSWLFAQIVPGAQHDQDNFLVWIANQNNSSIYHNATREALEYCVWIKRFAEAEGLSENSIQEEERE